MEHAQIKGMTEGVNYAAITELAEYALAELGFEIAANYPLVGKDFNVTRAGIHVDGLLKNEEIYNCFDTEKILGRAAGVAITDKSGAAGIKHWLDRRFSVNVPKDDARLVAIKEKVDAEYEGGRTSSISEEELIAWYREAFGAEPGPAPRG